MKDFWKAKPYRGEGLFYSKPIFTFDSVPNLSSRPFATIPKHPNKNLTYSQGRHLYRISPYGNFDRDAHLNIFDCRPFDPSRHKVPMEHRTRKVDSYFKPNKTWEDLWDDAEEDLPQAFKRGQEDRYSNYLKDALLEREKTYRKMNTPFKDVVGVYKLDKVLLDRNQTILAQQYLIQYFASVEPNNHFEFAYSEEPSKVRVTDVNTGKVEENVRIANYFTKQTPPWIRNLLTLLSPYSKLTIVISDYPLDVMKKSSVITQTDEEGGWELAWESCETLGRSVMGKGDYGYEVGSFGDISYGNAIAWFYLGNKEQGKDYPNGRVMLRWGTTTGKWEGTPDIGIEFVAHYSDPAGFYGMSGRSARGLIGELQNILLSKGYHSHQITTPYQYTGYSDVKGGSGTLHYGPFAHQSTEVRPLRDIKISAVSQKKLPEPFAFQLAQDPDEEIRERLAGRVTRQDDPHSFYPKLPKQVMVRLAKDPSQKVRSHLPYATFELPPEVTRILASDENPDILKTLSKRKDLPEDVRMSMIMRSETFARELAHYEKISEDERKILINHISDAVRAEFALRKDLSQEEMFAIANDKSPIVKLAFIKEQKLPRELWEHFCNDKDPDVRQKMAKLKTLPEDLMKQLADDDDENVRFAIVGRHNVPDDIVIFMIKNDREEFAQKVAGKEKISDDVLSALLEVGQKYPSILGILQRNEKISKDMREELTLRMIPNAGVDVVSNVVLTFHSEPIVRAVMDWLRKHDAQRGGNEYMGIVDSLSQNRELPIKIRDEIFALLYEIGDEQARKYLMANPTVNKEIKKIMKDKGYKEY